MIGRFAGFLRRFRRAAGGGVALMFALGGPVVILLAVGATDLWAVRSASARFQSIADAAALAGAPALALAADGSAARERADAHVRSLMSEWVDRPEYVAAYEVVAGAEGRALRVVLNGRRPSFFVNLLPPGGWKFRTEATASPAGIVPLCVLITGSSGDKLFNVKDSSRMNAPACLVHSNRDIIVEGGSVTAAMAQAVTKASGVINPSANTGAAAMDDPFAALDLSQSERLLCTTTALLKPLKAKSGVHYIRAGEHCGGIELEGTAIGILDAGDHFFLGGHLIVKEDARLQGNDVVLFFDKASKFEFKDRARVELNGRKSGAYAGLVMGGTRNNTEDFIISADNVDSLLGVIYVPSARLIIEGKADVARDSAWTVIVSKELQLKGSPSLFINASYSASDVPVPTGVGPRAKGARLSG